MICICWCGLLHVNVQGICFSKKRVYVCFRFFVMYLINKDETEHTGQVNQLISLCRKYK